MRTETAEYGESWMTGLLTEGVTPDALMRLVGTTAPRLIVVDYAETRYKLVARLLGAATTETARVGVPLRALLLMRDTGQGQNPINRFRFIDDAADLALNDGDQLDLDRQTWSEQQSNVVFTSAFASFMQRVQATGEAPPFPQREALDRPLLILAAALDATFQIALKSGESLQPMLDVEPGTPSDPSP